MNPFKEESADIYVLNTKEAAYSCIDKKEVGVTGNHEAVSSHCLEAI